MKTIKILYVHAIWDIYGCQLADFPSPLIQKDVGVCSGANTGYFSGGAKKSCLRENFCAPLPPPPPKKKFILNFDFSAPL